MKTAFSSFIYSRRGIYGILHILILLMSLFLVISISILVAIGHVLALDESLRELCGRVVAGLNHRAGDHVLGLGLGTFGFSVRKKPAAKRRAPGKKSDRRRAPRGETT